MGGIFKLNLVCSTSQGGGGVEAMTFAEFRKNKRVEVGGSGGLRVWA